MRKIKVILVEDEPPIIRHISRLVSSDLNFEIVATAYDGNEALEKLATVQPDVVFTDIQMPGMNGIDFLEELNKISPNTLAVIITSFDEFEYARRGIQLGIVDYLLKPIMPENLNSVLAEIKKSLYKTWHEKEKNILRNALDGQVNHIEHLNESNYHMALICIGSLSVSIDDYAQDHANSWDELNLLSFFSKTDNGETQLWKFQGISPLEKIIIATPNGNLETSLTEFYNSVSSHQNFPISAVYSNQGVQLSAISKQSIELRKRLYYKGVFGENSFIKINNLFNYLEEDTFGEDIFANFELHSTLGGINYLTEWCKDKKLSQYQLLNNLEQAILQSQNYKNTKHLREELRIILSNSWNYAQLGSELELLLIESTESSITTGGKALLEKVKDYLQENYASSISNRELAAKFGFAPAYLCRIFQKEYGVSPSKYMTQLRIEKAKYLFASHPEMMVKEVANLVGYTDSSYFSKVFYSSTNSWPSQFEYLSTN